MQGKNIFAANIYINPIRNGGDCVTRRIFRSVVMIAVLAVLLAAVLIVLSLFDAYKKDMLQELRTEAGYILHGVEREGDETAYFTGFSAENRVTLINGGGTVLYDSQADPSGMDNHAGRPEVLSALKQGWGESERYSDTLAETTYYFAVRTRSGNVLRLANTRSSVLGMFLQTLPVLGGILLLVVLFSLEIARVVSRRIVAPINALNLDAPLENRIYDEFSPLLTRMDRQRLEIDRRIAQLDAARRELNAITRNMREGLVIIDSRGTVLTMNESAARVFEADADACIGRDLLSFSPDEAVKTAVAAAQEGKSADLVMERFGRYHRLLVNPVSQSGRKAGVVLLTVDVTERYTAELSRREFTANVSHELKTPLTSISGYAELIGSGLARPEDVAGFAGRIQAESRRLMALINDILELSRLDEQRGLGEREQVSLLQLARATLQRLEKIAQEKNIALAAEGEAGCVSGYAQLLNQMIYNLVDNAVKYTPDGGSVKLRVLHEGGQVCLQVQDTGIGIPREHHPHIFERFYRVDKSHSRLTGGTGLGLSIVKHGAQIHNAQIQLDSDAGRGTCITLRFPAE